MKAGNTIEDEAGNALYSLAAITLALSCRSIDGGDPLTLSRDDTRDFLYAINDVMASIKRMVALAAASEALLRLQRSSVNI